MEKIKPGIISSGVPSLDEVIRGFRLGDNARLSHKTQDLTKFSPMIVTRLVKTLL